VTTTIDALIDLRTRSLDAYFDGRISEEASRADLDVIAVELDRVLSPDGNSPIEKRAARVVGAILADSRARQAAVPPAKSARVEFWRRHRLERLLRTAPVTYAAELREEADRESAEPDEVRMSRPVLAALRDQNAVQGARARMRAIRQRPAPEPPPARGPAALDEDWSEGDRLTWEEFIGGVPCQGCGRPFLGDETSQRDGEPWLAYRERVAPIKAEFSSRHWDHGTCWTVGGGPFHCRRCCAPHPLSPRQIEELNQLMNPPLPSKAVEVKVRHCGTCHKPLEADHVCELDDLPKRLRVVVGAILERDRGH
jgi:hypothetical protein